MPGAVAAFVEWILSESDWKVTERSGEGAGQGVRETRVLLFRRFISFGGTT